MKRGRSGWMLVGGQAVGQVGMLVALPIVTRTYTVHDVGLFQIASALALIAQPAATWRLEFIIPTADSESEARRDFRSGVWFSAIALAVSALISIIALLAHSADVATASAMVGPLVFAYGLLALDNAVLIRRGLTRELALRNFLSGVLGGAFQVVVALAGLPVVSLALAVLAARLVAILFTRRRWSGPLDARQSQSKYPLRRSVPTVLSGLVSNASVNALPLVIPASGGVAAAGYAGTAQRIAGAPVAFVGQALGQLVQGKVAPLVREGRPDVQHAVMRYLKTALLPTTLVAVALAVGGPLLAEPVLGPGWQPTGIMLAVLALPFSLQLLVAPINPVLVMIHRERSLLVMQVSRLVCAVAGAVVAAIATNDTLIVVAVFAVVTSAAYIVTVLVIYTLCGQWDRDRNEQAGDIDE